MSLFLYHLHDDILAYLLCKFLGQSLLLQQFNTIGHLKLLKTLFFGVLGVVAYYSDSLNLHIFALWLESPVTF